jgi:hypothetical protein
MDEFLDHTICCIKGCDLPSLALGLCNKHWRRTKAYGSPAVTQRHSGMFIGKTPEVRFKMQYKVAESGCWEWISGKDADGYGLFSGLVDGTPYKRAHRWSWAFHNKEVIQKWGNICHKCDNPSCVNPDHLWLGTAMENQQDKHRKGRANTPFGEKIQGSKLTEDQVRAILADPRPGSRIASEYGIAAGSVSDIKRRKSWAHLDVENVVKSKRTSPMKGKSSKLNEDAVRDIRSSTLSGLELAVKYDISPQQVCGIRKRRAWKHVE